MENYYHGEEILRKHYHNSKYKKMTAFQERGFRYEVMTPSFIVKISRWMKRLQRISKRQSAYGSLDYYRFDSFYKKEYRQSIIPEYYTVRIIYRKKLKQYIFCFNEKGVLKPVVNTLDMNIFYNPDVHMIKYKERNTIPASFITKQPNVVADVNSYEHHMQIKKIIKMTMKTHTSTNFFFFDEYFINYPVYLVDTSKKYPKECIELILRYKKNEEMKKYIYVLLGMYPEALEWVSEEELKNLFKENQTFFIDLYDSSLLAQQYISFFQEAN